MLNKNEYNVYEFQKDGEILSAKEVVVAKSFVDNYEYPQNDKGDSKVEQRVVHTPNEKGNQSVEKAHHIYGEFAREL